MKLLTVPARRGALWVRSGFRVFFGKPLAFAGLFAAFLFGVLMLLLLPGIGVVLMLAALPLVSQGFMLATQRTLAGQTPMAGVFIEPLRGRRPQTIVMLKIGLVYAGASVFIMWISDVVDGGTFNALQEAMTSKTADTDRLEVLLTDPRLLNGMLLRLGLAGLLAMPFWHAPALIHWGGQGAAQSLFSSTVACWRNKGAFLVFGLTWAALVIVFGVFVNTAFVLIGAPQLIPMAALPAGLMFSTVFYASLYFTYIDCFEQPMSSTAEASAAPPMGDDPPPPP